MPDQQTGAHGGGPRIVTLPERIDIGNARSVGDALQAIFDTVVTVVIADLTGTQTCSVTGVHELVLACERAAARNIDLRLAIPSGEARRVFALTGHDRWLRIYPDVPAALAGPDPPVGSGVGTRGYLPRRAQQEVPVTPGLLGAVTLVDDVQAGRREPAEHALPARVVVITGHIPLDDLAVYRGQAARAE